MRGPRIRLRSLMILIALLAPVFVAMSWVYELSTSLEDFYGPRGRLEMMSRISQELLDAREDLNAAQFQRAEAHYRTALALSQELRSTMARHGWNDDLYSDCFSGEILAEMSNALVGQHRDREAADVLEQAAEQERAVGLERRAKEFLARGAALRERIDGALP